MILVQEDVAEETKKRGVLQRNFTTNSSESDGYKLRKKRLKMPMTYQLYESQQEDLRGTINGPPSPDFHPEIASSILRKALEAGIQTDDEKITSTILKHDNYQRQKIIDAYSDMYKRDLLCDLQEETGGFYLELARALLTPAHTYSAQLIYDSITNRNGDRSVAVEILCTRTILQMKVIRESYLAQYRIPLEKDMELKVEGIFGRMLRILLKEPRKPRNEDQDDVDLKLVEKHTNLVLKLPDISQEIGSNVELFSELFVEQSWEQIFAFLQNFKMRDERKRSLQSYVKRDKYLHADIQNMLLVILKIAQSEQLYFAEKLHSALFDGDVDHKTIMRIVVTRCEIDLADICEIYENKYKRCLQFDLMQICSGEYAKLLSRLINCNGNCHEHIEIVG